jgi:hypothetical protein
MTISAFIELIRGPIVRHDWDVVRRAGPYVDAVLVSKASTREGIRRAVLDTFPDRLLAEAIALSVV